jgi:hypothetical protein
VVDRNDIVERLDQAADELPEDLSALLIEAADTIRLLRELVTDKGEEWLEGVQPEGRA